MSIPPSMKCTSSMKIASLGAFRNILRVNYLAPIPPALILHRYTKRSVTEYSCIVHFGMSLIMHHIPLSSQQTLLPGLSVSVSDVKTSSSSTADHSEHVYANQMVRTDSKAQKLDAFLQPANNLSSVPCLIASPPKLVPATADFEADINDGPEELLVNATHDMQINSAHVQSEAPLR